MPFSGEYVSGEGLRMSSVNVARGLDHDFQFSSAPSPRAWNKRWKDDQMRINEEAVSFSAFSLVKILVAELLRKRILDREELILAIRKKIHEQRTIAEPINEDAATRSQVAGPMKQGGLPECT